MYFCMRICNICYCCLNIYVFNEQGRWPQLSIQTGDSSEANIYIFISFYISIYCQIIVPFEISWRGESPDRSGVSFRQSFGFQLFLFPSLFPVFKLLIAVFFQCFTLLMCIHKYLGQFLHFDWLRRHPAGVFKRHDITTARSV